jgi:hypothetical protein
MAELDFCGRGFLETGLKAINAGASPADLKGLLDSRTSIDTFNTLEGFSKLKKKQEALPEAGLAVREQRKDVEKFGIPETIARPEADVASDVARATGAVPDPGFVERAQSEATAIDREAEGTSLSALKAAQVREAEGLQQLINKQGERNIARKERLINQYASYIADARLGYGGAVPNAEELVMTIQADNVGITKQEAWGMAREAMGQARTLELERRRKAQSVSEGTKEAVLDRAAQKRRWQSQFPGFEDQISDDHVRLESNGKLVLDPLSHDEYGGQPHFIDTQNETHAGKVMEKRMALQELKSTTSELRSDFMAAREAFERGEIPIAGPALGAKSVQEFTILLGIQHPAIARLQSALTEGISQRVKALQGSRPSDFDYRQIAMTFPTLTDFASPGGLAKMDRVARTVDIQIHGNDSPQTRAEIKRMKDIPETAADRRFRAEYNRFMDIDSPTIAEKARWMSALQEWQDTRGDRFEFGTGAPVTKLGTGNSRVDSVINKWGGE